MKILILRFSSFGDVTQALSVPSRIAQAHPLAEIHWAIRSDLASLLQHHPHIHRVWSIEPNLGLYGLIQFANELKKENFTHVYDAHNNLRSNIISVLLFFGWNISTVNRMLFQKHFIQRSIRRWKRFLLFNFRINGFQMPFSGQRDLLEPLKPWGVSSQVPVDTPQLFLQEIEITSSLEICAWDRFIILVPSAAFPLKRWPVEYWKQLIQEFPEHKFVLLGGRGDHFVDDLAKPFGPRCISLAGKTTLRQSAALVSRATAVVSNDTGMLHVAEQLGKPTIALMGPAPFGFPSGKKTKVMEISLPCRPCSKHGRSPCRNKKYQQCLRDLNPINVANELRQILDPHA